MELKTLACPNCHANLEVEDGIDTFFCKYCGHKILLQGQGVAAYAAKVQLKNMEHKERLQEKKDAQERYRMQAEQKDKKHGLVVSLCIFGAILAICLTTILVGNASVKKQEQELQGIIDQIMIDIENEDFASAYIKANSLYWDSSYTNEGITKWNAIRKETIKQIEEAEKKANDSSAN